MRRRLGDLILTIAIAVATSSAVDAALLNYTVTLTGPSEAPPNASPATGGGLIVYDDIAHTLQLAVNFDGLLGTTTASHLHAATSMPGIGSEANASAAGNAGVATTTPTLAGFPLGVSSGSFTSTLDLTLASSWNPSYVSSNGGTTGTAETALGGALAAGKAYWNIHTSVFLGGEIRGFATPIPEPSCLGLISLGGLAIGILRRRSP